MNVLTSGPVKERFSANALMFGINGNFITADQKAQLIAQGLSRKTLEEMEVFRDKLLGGMKKASEGSIRLSSIRRLLQSEFSWGKDKFSLLLNGLGEQNNPKKRRTIKEMQNLVEVGIEILQHKDLSSKDFRILFRKILASLKYFEKLREEQEILACLAAQNELNDADASPIEEKLPFFINATYYRAKAFSIGERVSLQETSRIFMQIIQDIIAPNFAKNLACAALRGDWEYFERSIGRISLLEKFQNDEMDYAILQDLSRQAENVILEAERRGEAIPDSSREIAFKIFQRSSQPCEPENDSSPIKEYRKKLAEFRRFFKEKINEDTDATLRTIQKEIHKKFLSFLDILLDDAFLILGPPPCKYDLRAYGSLAREEFCPYSDLEWMILIENKTEEARFYFKTLAQILNLEIISIGEAAPANIPIFSGTGPKHQSGLRIDSEGDPSQDERLIGTPNALAHLQVFSPGLDGSENPTKTIFSLRNTISLRTTDSDLFKNYAEKMRTILDENDLRKKRAFDFLKFRLANYKKLFATDWREAPIVHLKEQFFELLYHPLSDLALYFGCQNLNTLDVIDELPCFTLESRLALKEAVSFLYQFRVQVHFHYGEQKEGVAMIYRELKESLALESIYLLEATYLLIFSPFYSYLEHLFSQESFTIEEISLLDLAFEKACKTPDSHDSLATIAHLAKFLARCENPDERYYQQLSEKNLEPLREVYCDALQEIYRLNPESDFLKNLIARLEKIPDFSGSRLVLKRKKTAFFQKLLNITSSAKPSKDKYSVRIYSPFFEKRYLLSEVLDIILDETGHIKRQMQNTNSRVSSYEKEGIAFHFKEKPAKSPFHPGRARAAAELMFRLFGRGTSISELFEFEVEFPDKEPQKYLVLVSETVFGASPNPENPPLLDPIQLSELFLSLPLLLPGDMRPENLIESPESELISVDNDVSWVKPYTQDGCNLYTILPFLYPEHVLHPDVVQSFLSLKPVFVLTSWLTEIIDYNQRVSSVFRAYEEIPEEKLFFESIYYTSTCCFEKGTGAQLLLQFHQLQEFLRKNQDRPIAATEILQTIISMDQDTTVSIGTTIYEEYQRAQMRQELKVADKPKEVMTRRVRLSASSAPFYQKIPQNEELFHSVPEQILEEMKNLSILKINEIDGLFLKIGEFSSLHLQRIDVFREIDPAIQRFLFKILLLHHFEHLNLSYSYLEDTELKDLLQKTGKHLKVLDLRGCSNLTKKSIESINQFCPFLEELYLSRCDQIESFTVGLFQNSVVLPNLKVLHLEGCPRLRSFKIHAPNLLTLKIAGNPLLVVSKKLATCLSKIDRSLHNLGKYAEALEYKQQALGIYRQLFKTPHLHIAMFLNDIGVSLHNLEKYAEALEYKQQALEMYKQLLESPHRYIATTLHNFSMSLNNLGRHDEALECDRQALKMRRQLFNSPHQDIATSLHNVGVSLGKLGRYEEALEYDQQALEMRKQLFKPPQQA